MQTGEEGRSEATARWGQLDPRKSRPQPLAQPLGALPPLGALLTVNPVGTFAYDPNGQFEALGVGDTATDTFTYNIEDPGGLVSLVPAKVTITIHGVDDAPVAVDDPGGTTTGCCTTDEDTLFPTGNVLDNDTDPSMDLLTVHSFDDFGTMGIVVDNGDGTFAYDPNGQFESLGVGDTATDTFTYDVEDPGGLVSLVPATVTITINGVNDPPVANDDAFVTDEATAVNGDVLADNGSGVDDDVDGDPLTVASVNGAAGDVGVLLTLPSGALLTVDLSGTFVYDPNGQFDSLGVGDPPAVDSFIYEITDGNGGVAGADVTVSITPVNNAPVARDDDFTTNEATPATGNVLVDNGFGPDFDVSGDVLAVVSFNGNPANVGPLLTLPSGAKVRVKPNGSLSFDPNGQYEHLGVGETATESFTYEITDGNGGFSTATVTITVTGLDDPTIAVDDSGPGFEAPEDVVSFVTGDVLANDFDLDFCDGVAVATPTATTTAAGGTLTYNGDGTFTYTPPADFNGIDMFSYSVVPTDLCAIPLGDPLAVRIHSNTAIVSIAVLPRNDPPDAHEDLYDSDEDMLLVTPDVRANDTDPDFDPLSVSAFDTTATAGTVVNNGDGTFDYTPPLNFNGIDTFEYTITDGNGAFDSATVTIRVRPINDDPDAVDDDATTDEDSNVVGNVKVANPLVADSDPEGDPLVVVAVNGVAANVGTQFQLLSGAKLKVNANGVFIYKPNGQFEHLAVGDFGMDSFAYTIGDGNGGFDSATVKVVIHGANDPPDAVDDDVTTDEDSNVAGNVRAANPLTPDSDPDGDPLVVAAVNGLAGQVGVQFLLPSGAKLTVKPNGVFNYKPNGQFEHLAVGDTAIDWFTYTIIDGNGGTDSATVFVLIHGVNDAPVAVDDSGAGFGTDEDTAFTTGNVLGNDTDPDGDVLSVAALDTSATTGTVVDNGDGTFDYDPDGQFDFLAPGAATTDSFGYTAGDGNGGTDTATVTIDIVGVNHAPTDILLSNDSVLENSPTGTVVGDFDRDRSRPWRYPHLRRGRRPRLEVRGEWHPARRRRFAQLRGQAVASRHAARHRCRRIDIRQTVHDQRPERVRGHDHNNGYHHHGANHDDVHNDHLDDLNDDDIDDRSR